MFWWCSGGGVLVAFWWCGGVLCCSSVLVVFCWCSGGVLEVLLDLLQPVLAVLVFQVNLGPLKMVPNDSPY